MLTFAHWTVLTAWWATALPVALLCTAIIALVLAGTLVRRSTREEVSWFALFLICCALWCGGYGLEMLAPRLEDKMAWIKVEYVGMCLGPVFYMGATLRLATGGRHPTRRELAVLCIVPLMLILAMCTNEWHEWMYRGIHVRVVDGIAIVGKERPAGYFVNVIYAYVMIGVATVALLGLMRQTGSVFRRQGAVLLIGVALPWVANIVFVVRGSDGIDMAPVFMTFNALLVAWGLFRHQLFDLLPAARDAVFADLSAPVAVTDDRGRVVDLNVRARALAGGEAAFGRPLPEAFGRLRNWPTELGGGQPSRQRLVDGETVYELDGSPIRGRRGEFQGTVWTLRDITPFIRAEQANREREEALRALNGLKDKLFSIIAHDLRGPFNAVFGLIDTLQEKNLPAAERAELLALLRASSESTLGLLDNLFTWARLQSGRMRVQVAAQELGALVREKFEPWQVTAQRKNLTLASEVPEDIRIWADRDMLGVVLHNLLSNALKFTPRGGCVRVGAQRVNGGVCVWVQDTGIGMDEKTRAQLFSLESGQSRVGTAGEPGSGFGLVVCREFIERHGGRIEVASAPGQGSRFSIWLPDVTG